MKKRVIAILVASSIVFNPFIQAAEVEPHRFKDKPVITYSEKYKIASRVVRILGTLPAAVLGGLTGWYVLYDASLPASIRKLLLNYFVKRGSGGTLSGPALVGGEWVSDEGAGNIRRGMAASEKARAFKWNISALIGAVGGTVLYYKLIKFLEIAVFARQRGVSYQIAKICFYYNINVGQYRTILTAAEQRKPEGLLNAINELYPKRFGSDWKIRMKTLFDLYGTQVNKLVSKGSFSKAVTGDERDFVRMVELGAAMANLYYGTKPNRKTAIDSAMKLYREIGVSRWKKSWIPRSNLTKNKRYSYRNEMDAGCYHW